MRTDEPQTIYLKDYKAPDFRIEEITLDVTLDPQETQVIAEMNVSRSDGVSSGASMVLDGDELKLKSISIDGQTLSESDYDLSETSLTFAPPDKDNFTLRIENEITPEANKALLGLYMSDGMYCTQCEAEGFRRITFYQDRPDVMAKFTTRITAPKESFPVLLSNGNCVKAGDLEGGLHFAEWEDPFPKPAYLFALVAGNLACVDDEFTTISGRKIDLKIFVEKGKEGRTAFAMDALKRSMKWDEENYGREYDLDIFMIVAVSSFNMGAMENKGLNIFNDACVLADPETATDANYASIEAIVAHEYFHNWTGNRITCRDWFQLCLKEGLTVFRDQQFSADMRSKAVTRITDVQALRTRQLPEDTGPLAHPVRPESFIEIDNFYTATVYEKGAELCHMLHTILGAEGFRKGTDLYFDRHDGEAATVEDFVTSLGDANSRDLSSFMRWYAQAGTPKLFADTTYCAETGKIELCLKQTTDPAPGQDEKLPLQIPVRLAFIDEAGKPIEVEGRNETLVILDEAEKTFTFESKRPPAAPSLLRHYSAPVTLQQDLSPDQRAILMAFDTDPFNRWEASQQFATHIIHELLENPPEIENAEISSLYIESFGRMLADKGLDPALKATVLDLPSEAQIAQAATVIDPEAIHSARTHVLRSLSNALGDDLLTLINSNRSNEPFSPDAQSAGRRALKNASLRLLSAAHESEAVNLAVEQLSSSDNMTDTMAALTVFRDLDCEERETALNSFYDRWQREPLVIDKWFGLQATSSRPDTLSRVRSLMENAVFQIENPNRVRALIGAFAMNNQLRFNESDGEAYAFFADQILKIDSINPNMAARLTTAFSDWKRFDSLRQNLIRKQLERIISSETLSKNVYEIATRTLGDS